jgi:hypothetical protein
MIKKSTNKIKFLLYEIKIFCVIVVMLVSFFTVSINSNALSYGFETTDLSESNKESIWENINLRNFDEFNIENNSLPIMSFDVSTTGNIVLGLQNNKILILNENNDVLKCFEFTNDGTFYAKWNNENVLLFMSRGSIVVEFSLEGNLVNMIEIDTSNVNNNKLWNEVIHNTRVSLNGFNYYVQNDLGILNLFTFRSFSQLVKSDENGVSTVIYDVNENQLDRIVATTIMLSLFICVCSFMVIGKIKESKRRH